MDVGVLILPEHRWADAEAVWRRAEEIGFAHVWTYDHLAWRTLRDDPWHAAVPVLAAAAMVTSRIRLGTLVATPNFRHPVTFARELVTLDDLSDGRLTVGLGAGGPGWDASMLGQPTWSAGERAERFAEFVALLDRLLREPNTSYDGRYFRAVEARTAPGCVQRPRVPLAVAATGPRGMRVAATHGETWVTNGDRSYTGPPLGPKKGAAVFRRQAEMVDEVCRGIGPRPGHAAPPGAHRPAARRRPGVAGRLRGGGRDLRGGGGHRPRRPLAPARRALRGRPPRPRPHHPLSHPRACADRHAIAATVVLVLPALAASQRAARATATPIGAASQASSPATSRLGAVRRYASVSRSATSSQSTSPVSSHRPTQPRGPR